MYRDCYVENSAGVSVRGIIFVYGVGLLKRVEGTIDIAKYKKTINVNKIKLAGECMVFHKNFFCLSARFINKP